MKSLVAETALVQNAAMLRRFSCLILALAVAGCTAPKAPPATSVPSAIPPAPSRGEPSQYINMPVSGLQAAFGKPAFVRKDGATEMWRYDGQSCRAFFFLYGSPLMVRHVETLPHGAQGTAADIGCLTVLRAAPPKTS